MATTKLFSFIQKLKKECGVTLLELMIVMGIISSLLLLGVGSFISMRRVRQLEQTSQSLYSLITNEQREALLYNRQLGESWVWGIVIDLRDLSSSDVLIYKYCAPTTFSDFVPYPDKSEILPVSAIVTNKNCQSGSASLATYKNESLGEKLANYKIFVDRDSEVGFLVFETVSGKVHFYSKGGSYITPSKGFNIVMNNNSATNRTIVFDKAKSRFNLKVVQSDYIGE